MKIAITAESTIDLPKSLLTEFGIRTLPFSLVMGEKQVLDGEVNSDDLYAFVAETGKLPMTAAVNDYQYEEFFRDVLKDFDAVVHFSLSSKISAACSNATRVSHEEEFEGKVFVIDTLSLSTGIALLAIRGAKLAEQGAAPEEIVKDIETARTKDQTSFVIETLDYLYKGGRCSKLALFGANLMKIKPQILMINGGMGPGKKYTGNIEKAIHKYVEDILKQFPNADLDLVFVTHTLQKDKRFIAEDVAKRMREFGCKRVEITHAGGTISCHCGPNTLGILYLTK